MKTAREGISVFNRFKVRKGEFVGIYSGELLKGCMGRLDRSRLGPGEGTHYFSLSWYGLVNSCIDGSLHDGYDLEHYIKKGVGSFFNSGTREFANCIIRVFPLRLDAEGQDYALGEVDGIVQAGKVPFWVLLEAKEDIEPKTHLRWDYPVDPLGNPQSSREGEVEDEHVDVDSSQSSVVDP